MLLSQLVYQIVSFVICFSQYIIVDYIEQEIDSKKLSSNIIFNEGDWFALSGWAKYNLVFYSNEQLIDLVQIQSIKSDKFKESNWNIIFNLKYYINKKKKNSCYINASSYFQNYPTNSSSQYQSKIFSNILQQENSLDLYNGIQEWHFFIYEFINGDKGILQIHFFNDLGIWTSYFGNDLFNKVEINLMFKIYVGKKPGSKNRFFGQLYKFIFYNNSEEGIKNFQELNKGCFTFCENCDGPFDNNCLSCKQNTNRIFLEEKKECVCQLGYKLTNQQECKSYTEIYPNLQISELVNNQEHLCELGSYVQPISSEEFQCFVCPKNNKGEFYCLECIMNPYTWYKSPYCQYYLQQRRQFIDDAYLIDEQARLYYYINEQYQLIRAPYIEDFCKETIFCSHEIIYHLNQSKFVAMKDNSFDEEQLYQNSNCFNINFYNSDCNQCLPGYQFLGLNCKKCNHEINDRQKKCNPSLEFYKEQQFYQLNCGQTCKQCKFHRCWQCIDDFKFFVASDGKNCRKNEIPNCIQAFQALAGNFKHNTLKYEFEPFEQKDSIILCARCEDNYSFIFSLGKCVKNTHDDCLFGVSQTIIQNQDNSTQNNNHSIYYNGTVFDAIQYQCLISLNYSEKSLQFYNGCNLIIAHCITCLFYKNQEWVCLKCEVGYNLYEYNQFLTPCVPCFLFGRDYCISWSSYENLNIVSRITAMQQYIEGEINYFFPSIHYYQIDIYDEQIQNRCHKTCLECAINQVCLRCKSDILGRPMSLSQSKKECIECPSNCALCTQRTVEQISLINPLFNDNNNYYSKYTRKCLRDFNEQENYYDRQIGQFVKCANYSNCKKQLIIELNLICSKEDYFTQLEQVNENERSQFQSQNLLFEDFLINQFSYYDTQDFYEKANKESIQSISVKITTQKYQICSSQQMKPIINKFSQNIFSAIEVNLEFNFQFEVKIILQDSLKFWNFTTIKLKGLNIQSKNKDLQNFISFESLMLSSVFLDNFTIQNALNLINCNLISFVGVSQININNFYLSLTEMNYTQLFLIKSNASLLIINFSQITLLNNKLNHFSLVVFSFEKNIEIIFKDIQISNCEFNDSNLAQKSIQDNEFKSTFIQEVIQLYNIQIINTKIINYYISENQQFLHLSQITVANIKNFSIIQSYMLNSYIFILNNNAFIENISIKECVLVNSKILINTFGKNSSILYEMKNLQFIENSYSSNSNFIRLLSNNLKNSQLNLERLIISKNLLANYSKQTGSYTLHQTLIYIDIDIVTLTDIVISRGQGLIEISFAYQTTLIIKGGVIFQNQQILGIHEKLECNLDFVNTLSTVFNLYQTNKLLMQDIQIKKVETVNSPIIFYRSLHADSNGQNFQLSIINLTVEQSLTQVLSKEAEIGILKVQTDQIIYISIQDCNFDTNIIQGFKGTLDDQALVLNIDAKLSDFKLLNTKFKQNLALNSESSLNSINCKIIQITNCSFVKNNMIEYQIIQPFLHWDFPFHAQVYLEDILNILKIDSIISNGLFKFQTLVMEDIQVKESKAVLGIGFLFLPQNQSEIILRNIKLNDLQNTLQYSESGVFIIDFSNSLNANVKISEIIGDQIHFFNKGSFFSFLNCNIPVKIIIEKTRFKDVFSPSASIININFQNESNYIQSIHFKDLHYQNTLHGWENYLYKYYQENIILNEDFEITNNFFHNRTVFYICSGKNIEFHDFLIIDLFMESGFILVDVSNLVLSDIQIINSTIHQNLILISQKDYSLHSTKIQTVQSEILIQNIKIDNLSFKNIEIHCKGLIRGQSQLLCNSETVEPPKTLYNFETNIIKYCQNQETDVIVVDSPISFLQISNKVIVKQLELKNIFCLSCLRGLVQVEFMNKQSSNQKLQLYNSILLQSQCGQFSCIHIRNIQNQLENEKLSTNMNYTSILKQNEILIDNYFCQNNQAYNGTCLFINNLRLMIKNSIFSSNKAIYAGGALYLTNNYNDIKIERTFIFNNYAIFGGGVYINNQFSQNFKRLQSFIQNNQAFAEGQNIYSNPIKLQFQLGFLENYCEIKKVSENITDIVEEVQIQENKTIFGINSNFLLLPNGQKISKYQYFDWKNRKYFNPNLTFRIVPISQNNEKSVSLSNSFCIIKSGILTINKDDQKQSIQYTNNYTSYSIIKFNEQSQDYNLDDLELYFDKESDDSKVLSLEFQCNSVSVPTFNNKYPYNFISNNQNYTLRFYIKALPCQLGEIKNSNKSTCDVCDSSQGFYILQLNQNNCQMRDDISTIEVTPAQLKLRQGFWRPYFDTSIISDCSNLPSNCLGGWIEGDTSCLAGHIGAQCEQCDLLNIKGDGQYFRKSGYSCQMCYNQMQNIIMIVFLSIYILLSIMLSVTSNIQSVEQQLKMIKMKLIGFRVIFQYNSKAILFKLLSNYFQIMSVISNIQSNFSEQFKGPIDITTTPSQELTFSFDCILSQKINLSIHYIRMAIQLFQPIFYTIVIFIIYFFSHSFLYKQFNKLFISTTLIYVYIYFQPNLVGKLVQLLSYREISKYKWILAHVAFRYDEQIHIEIMVYILIPILTIIGIFIPSFFFYGLFINQNKLDLKAVRLKWGYLYCEYRKEAYLWEILRIWKKILLLGFLNYYQDFSKIQAIIIILTLLLYLQISKNFKPYSSKQLSNLDYTINNTCLLSTCILLTENSIYNSEYSKIQQFIFIAINLRLIKIILQELILSYLQEISQNLRNKIDYVRDMIRKKFPFLQKFPIIWRTLKNNEQKQKRIQNLYQKLKAQLIVQRKLKSEKQISSNHKTLMTLTDIKQAFLKSSNSPFITQE